MKRVLLDTCTFLWLTAEPKKLSAVAKKIIDTCETLVLSDVSALEVCMKWRSGKLPLPTPPRVWLQEQAKIWQVEWLPLAKDHMFRASELAVLHADPFDRLLVAQAIAEELCIVTPDAHVGAYPVGILW